MRSGLEESREGGPEAGGEHRQERKASIRTSLLRPMERTTEEGNVGKRMEESLVKRGRCLWAC
jgi:hypothetical protein